ncbi:MAG: bis(5'-nucleosyl)-tetraphosphatase (symmetrical) YqeK [Clostridia bacterium]
MMDESKMIEKLEGLLTPCRFKHSIGVRDTAVGLAKIYGGDAEKARIAGLLHDCAKDVKKQQILQQCDNFGIVLDEIEKTEFRLVHGPLGVKFAQCYFGIEDKEILNAIYYHTVGKENMDILTKIIYLADFIEPNRDFPGVENLRKTAQKNLDKAIVLAIDGTILHVLEKGRLIHPSTINARNYILLNAR